VADEPISQLTQISPPPFATAFTSPTTGAMLEILDTTNTSMASSGTNSKIAPGDLLKGYLAAGTNVTLTETSGIVTIAASGGGGMTVGSAVSGGSNYATLVEDGSGNLKALAIGTTGQVLTVASGTPAPAWATPAMENFISAAVASGAIATIGSAMGNLTADLSITLPNAGTYLLWANIRCQTSMTTATVGQNTYLVFQLYDSTHSVVPTNAAQVGFLVSAQAAFTGQTIQFQSSTIIGPLPYTVTGSSVIHLQGTYGGSATIITTGGYPQVLSNTGQGYTTLNAMQIY
jgi:hypothetical protein